MSSAETIFLLHAVTGPEDPHFEKFLQEARAAAAVRHAHLVVLHDALLDRDGRVVVSDFGLACTQPRPGASATSHALAGTPAYMAPEMFDGAASPRSDVYALGIVAFELLTGAKPFVGDLFELRERHASAPLPSEPLRERGVDPALIEVIERATHKSATLRYKTAAHFLRALKKCVPDRQVWSQGVAKLAHDAARCRGDSASESAAESRTPPSPSYYDHLATIATAKCEREGRDTTEAADIRDSAVPGPKDTLAIVRGDAPDGESGLSEDMLQADSGSVEPAPASASSESAAQPAPRPRTPREMLTLEKCPQCEYSLEGLLRRYRCPECGFECHPGRAKPPRRSYVSLLLGLRA